MPNLTATELRAEAEELCEYGRVAGGSIARETDAEADGLEALADEAESEKLMVVASKCPAK